MNRTASFLSKRFLNTYLISVNYSRCLHSSPFYLSDPTTNDNNDNIHPLLELDKPVERTKEEIQAERKARKERKKKSKQAKEKVHDEDEVEKKKRLSKEKILLRYYQGDGSEFDKNCDDLNDDIICERLTKILDAESRRSFIQMKHQFDKEGREYSAFLPSSRYWEKYGVTPNPYFTLRFNQAYSKWAKRDLRTLSNKQYQDKKYNTLARMSATQKFHEIFPDVCNKFTPTINLLVEFTHPIVRDILVYHGNVIPAEFTDNQPSVTFEGHHKSYYTLMLVDGKNTSYLKDGYGQTIQWLITNIPGRNGDITQGSELVEYFGTTPIKEYGRNRLVFLLFRQNEGLLNLDFKHINKTQFIERENFDVKEFALQNELLPRGLAFYTCTYDRTVPKKFESLGYGEPQFIKEEHIERKQARKDRRDIRREGTSKKWTWPMSEELENLAKEQ